MQGQVRLHRHRTSCFQDQCSTDDGLPSLWCSSQLLSIKSIWHWWHCQHHMGSKVKATERWPQESCAPQ